MATTQSDVQLLIRARDEASATIKEIVSGVEDFISANRRADKATAENDSTLASLSSEYVKLKEALDGLRQAGGVAETFRRAADAAEKAQAKVRDATETLNQHKAAQEAAAAEVEQARAAYERSQASVDGLKAKLDELNATRKDVESAERLLRQYHQERAALDELTAAYNRLKQDLKNTLAGRSNAETEITRLNSVLEENKARLAALGEEYKRLEQSSRQGAGVEKQIEQYRKVEERLAGLQSRLAKQVERQDELNRKFRESDEPSRTLIRNLEASGRAVESTQKQIARTTGDLDRLGAKLSESGVDVSNLAQANAQMAAQTAQTATRLEAIKAEMEQLTSANKDVENSLQETNKAFKDADKAAAQSQKELDALAKARARSARAMGEARGALDGYGFELRNLESDLREQQTRLRLNARTTDLYASRLEKAQAANNELKAAVSAANASLRSQDREVTRAQAAVDRAQAAAERQQAAMRESAEAARAAGIDTSNLAAWQNRIQQEFAETAKAAKAAARDMKAYERAAKRAARGSRKASDDTSLFADNSRKAMSVLQRMRGQILSLAASYVGLYGAIHQVGQATQAYMDREATVARFSQLLGGNQAAIAEELAFVGNTADRLGLQLQTLEAQYSRFAVSSRLAGAEAAETRTIFEAVAEAATVMRLSNEELEGALRALDQIMGKGKVQAEELRGQLGDRFPGAVSIMARALGKTTAELDAMLEAGTLTREALLGFAVEIKDQFGPALEGATTSFRAELNRLINEVYRLRLLFGEDFAAEVSEPLGRLADALGSPEVRDAVQSLAVWLGRLVSLGASVAEEFTLVTAAAKILLGALAVRAVYSFGVALAGVVTNLRAVQLSVASLTSSLALLRAALATVFAFFAGWQIGSWLREFESVQQGMNRLINYFHFFAVAVATEWEQLWARLELWALQAQDAILGTLADWRNDFLGVIADILDSLGFDGAAAKVRAGMSEYRSALKQQIAKAEQDLDALERRQEERLLEVAVLGDANAASISAGFERRGAEGDAGAAEREARERWAREEAERRRRAMAEQQAAAERAAIEKNLAKQLDQIRRQLAEAEADTLDERLDLVRMKYAQLIEDLLAVGNEEGVGLVENLIAYEQAEEKAAFFAEKQAAQREKLRQAEESLNRAMRTREALIENIRIRQEQGDLSAIEAKKEIARLDEEQLPIIRELAEEALKYAEALGRPDMVANLQNVIAGLKPVRDQLISTHQVNERLAGGFTDAFDAGAEGIADLLQGAGSLGDAFRSAGDAFRQFAADFLREIARMILQQTILNALQNSSIGGMIAGGVNASVQHSGGVVGATANRSREVSPLWFANAMRFHAGGLPGLKRNEVPTILEKGEEVLSKNDPRNVLNGGSGRQGGNSGDNLSVKVINTLDAGDVVSAGLSSAPGERVLLNVVSRNRNKIKQMLG